MLKTKNWKRVCLQNSKATLQAISIVKIQLNKKAEVQLVQVALRKDLNYPGCFIIAGIVEGLWKYNNKPILKRRR